MLNYYSGQLKRGIFRCALNYYFQSFIHYKAVTLYHSAINSPFAV